MTNKEKREVRVSCKCDNGKVYILNMGGDLVQCRCKKCNGTGYVKKKN